MRKQVIFMAMTATAAQAWVPMPSFTGLTRGFASDVATAPARCVPCAPVDVQLREACIAGRTRHHSTGMTSVHCDRPLSTTCAGFAPIRDASKFADAFLHSFLKTVCDSALSLVIDCYYGGFALSFTKYMTFLIVMLSLCSGVCRGLSVRH